jgi:hypothetical protein
MFYFKNICRDKVDYVNGAYDQTVTLKNKREVNYTLVKNC